MSKLFDQARARLRNSIDDKEEAKTARGDGPADVSQVAKDIQEAAAEAVDNVVASPFRLKKALQQRATKKVLETQEKFTDLLPALAQAGFRLDSCAIDASMSPTIMSRFSVTRQLTDEEEEEFLAANRGNRFAYLLFESLFRAVNVAETLDFPGLHFAGLEVRVTASPKVSMLYRSVQVQELGQTVIHGG
ncbi:MAG: hypothetical protein RRC34_12535 [Lentisphaeria bacterium]|nr:hypothetical protein [Lentisphaeria bacterium]